MKQHTLRTFLCSHDKSEICEIEYSDISHKAFLVEFDELDLMVESNEKGILSVKDERFDLATGMYLIRLDVYTDDSVDDSKFFSVVENELSYNEGSTYNKITCYSSAYIPFTKRKLRGYNEPSANLRDILTYILNDVLYGAWDVGTLPAKADTEYQTLEFQENSLWDVLQSLSKSFDVIFEFDTVNNEVSCWEKGSYTTIEGLVLSESNFVNSLVHKPKYDGIVTRLWVYGKSGVSVAQVNKFGTSYIDNFDYPISQGWFSPSLLGAWNAFVVKANGYDGAFNTLISNLNTYYSDLLILENDLVNLKTQNSIYEDEMAVYKNTYPSENSAYQAVWADNQDILSDIATKEAQIVAKQGQITSTQNSINAIVADLAYTNPVNFTTAQLKELTQFIQEDVLKIETLDNAQLLLEYGQTYLSRKNIPVIETDVDIIDVFSCGETELVRDKINIGSYVYFDIPSIGWNYNVLQLISYTHDPISASLVLKFSNTNRIESDMYYLNDIFKKANATATQVGNNAYEWGEYVFDKPNLLTNESEISTITNKIVTDRGVLDKRGFTGTDIGGDDALQLMNDKLVLLRDGGEKYNTLLSANGFYLENDTKTNRVVITPGSTHSPNGGFQIDKNVGTPEDPIWDNRMYLGTDDEYFFEGNIYVGDDAQNVVIDRFGLDPTYAVWYKNMLPNTGAFIAKNPPIASETAEFPVWQWDGCVSSISATFIEGRSFKVAYLDTLKSAPAFGSAKCNLAWLPATIEQMRFSFWSKFGQTEVKIRDETNSNYFSIAKGSDDVTVGTYSQTFDRNADWKQQPDSVWFDITEAGHANCEDVRVEIRNVYNENLYVNAPQLTIDKTGKWPQSYIKGPYSLATSSGATVEGGGLDPSGDGGTLGNLFVEDEFPDNSPEKSVLVDTDDFSRYDKTVISSNTQLQYGDNEYLNITGTTTVTLFAAQTVESEGAGKVAVVFAKNTGTNLVTINVISSGTIDGSPEWFIYPNEQYEFYSAGTEWKVS